MSGSRSVYPTAATIRMVVDMIRITTLTRPEASAYGSLIVRLHVRSLMFHARGNQC